MADRYANEDRILVCLSTSPSNKTVITAAVRIAAALNATLTAVYIRPTNYDNLPDEDKDRLQRNVHFAEQNGASVTTVIGDDVAVQIAEFAQVSGATKIVVGQSGAKRQHFWSKAPLTEQIIMNAPNVDVYIIPDSSADIKKRSARLIRSINIKPTWKDTLITLLLLIATTCVGLAFTWYGFSESNIITVFILGVLIISVATTSPIYSAVSSLASVLLFNYFFIEPKFSFHTYETEYAVTFVIMLISSLITGTLAGRLKDNARHAAHEAFRARVLFDTNQLLQKTGEPKEAISITAHQVNTLLNRDVVVFPLESSHCLGPGILYNTQGESGTETILDNNATDIAKWAFDHHQPVGAFTEEFPQAKFQYHAIYLNDHCYGVIGINMEERELESFEYSVFMSILGECALALDGLRNAAEKEEAAVLAKNEQLRANLLRSISHDIRTPLTSISGNASNLLFHYDQLDSETLKQTFTDIYDDSIWLIDLVENLLSISRIENGRMNLHLSTDIVNDVINEAIKHIDRNISHHKLEVDFHEELLLADMDTRLITQVLINLINNAVKNTQEGSLISVSTARQDKEILVTVKDNGPGIPDDIKPRIFEMFYTGKSKIADGRRGLGLGLPLCRSIVEAHGGVLTLSDNIPTGCCFTFTLPIKEVDINE